MPYCGTLQEAAPGFGFIMSPVDEKGRPFAGYDAVTGVFVQTKTLRDCIDGCGKKAMRELNGAKLVFDVRQSDQHPGKLEAYWVRVCEP